jgi:hypothetical protein
MPNLHYYVNIVDYIEISNKFNGVLETFMDLINTSKISKGMSKTLSSTMKDIESALSTNKRLVCVSNGYTKNVGGNIEYLNMNLARTRITMNADGYSSKDEGFQVIVDDFIHNLTLALKSFNLETSAQIIRVSTDMYHCTVNVTDYISIDIDIHIPAEHAPEDEDTDEYYTTLWIEFGLDLGNDSVID